MDYEFKDSNGESVTRKINLPEGELVVFDTDRIYEKEKLPNFSRHFEEKLSYEEFEERFIKEQEENQNR